MDKETAMAINNISKRMTEMERKLEVFLLSKHDENVANIDTVDNAIQDLAEVISASMPE